MKYDFDYFLINKNEFPGKLRIRY